MKVSLMNHNEYNVIQWIKEMTGQSRPARELYAKPEVVESEKSGNRMSEVHKSLYEVKWLSVVMRDMSCEQYEKRWTLYGKSIWRVRPGLFRSTYNGTTASDSTVWLELHTHQWGTCQPLLSPNLGTCRSPTPYLRALHHRYHHYPPLWSYLGQHRGQIMFITCHQVYSSPLSASCFHLRSAPELFNPFPLSEKDKNSMVMCWVVAGWNKNHSPASPSLIRGKQCMWCFEPSTYPHHFLSLQPLFDRCCQRLIAGSTRGDGCWLRHSNSKTYAYTIGDLEVFQHCATCCARWCPVWLPKSLMLPNQP